MARLFSRRQKAPTERIDLSRLQVSSTKIPLDRMTPKSQRTPRAYERKESWAVCQVALETGPVREGVLLDMSDGGARVRFRTRGQLPERVHVKASRYGLNRKAIVVWQDVFDAGLRFIDD